MSEINPTKQRVIDTFQEMKEYSEALVTINKGRDSKISKIKQFYEKNKNPEEVKAFAFDAFFLSSFQNLDLQIMQTKFVSYVELYLVENEKESLDKELLEAYKLLKERLPKRTFLVKNSELVEVEEGIVEAKKKKYEEQNLFKIAEQQLKTLLDVRKN